MKQTSSASSDSIVMTRSQFVSEQIKKLQNFFTALQSILIVILIGLVSTMMVQIGQIQGTARVINYAGLVRGATQRLVKLEITDAPNNNLIQYLDNILTGLKYGTGEYKLVRIPDDTYQQKLDEQVAYWEKLKQEILLVRENGYLKTDVVGMSETYFDLADQTVTAAEDYSEMLARHIRSIEYISAADMILLLVLILRQYITARKIAKANKILQQKAYLDVHTGLPNKSRCEELLQDSSFISAEEPIGCLVFDLNNLKTVNDSLGHSAGDALISNFARILRNTIPSMDFVGRYGGDEFMAVIYNTDEPQIMSHLKALKETVDRFNQYGKHTPISYAFGWAVSTEYKECTLRTLFDKADHYMYLNKQKSKMGREYSSGK